MLAAAAILAPGDPGDQRRRLPLAFVASTLLHAAIGIGLALWLVPGQQSSLPLGAASLAVTIRPAALDAAAMPTPPDTPAVDPAAEAHPALTVASAPVSVARADSSSPNATVPAQEAKAPTPTLVAKATAAASAPPVPAVAAGTTTLAIDATIPANVVFDALAVHSLGKEFPVEVGKLVRLRSTPPVAYPPAALKAQKEGSVLALVIVDEHGMPYDISLMEFDKEFVEAAEAALKLTRFTPAEDMNGNPIMFYTMVRIRFLGSTPGRAGDAR